MARGIPQSRSKNAVVPLPLNRLEDVPIARIGAFRTIETKKDRQTDEEYESDQVKLSIDFDSGYIQRNADGDPVLDQHGNEQIHYINQGFVTLSGHARANLMEILKAAGFDSDDFIDDEGGLSEEASKEIEVEFGTNGLGDDYSGKEWDDLPYYTPPSRGGNRNVSKRDVEVPVLSFKIMGYELIGRKVDLALETKDGWNRVKAYIAPRTPEPLSQDTKAKRAKGMPKSGAREPVEDPLISEQEKASRSPTAPPFEEPNPGEPEPTTKRAIWVTKTLQEFGVPGKYRLEVVRAMAGNPDIESIHGIAGDDAKRFKAMVEADATNVREAYEMVKDKVDGDNDNDDDFDDDEDEDFA
jgi:hypothetical protein